MNDLIRQFGRLRLLALLLTFLPLAAMPLAGVVWLWQSGYLLYWLLLLVVCGALALGLQWWLARRDRHELMTTRTQPEENWSPTAGAAWAKIEALAQAVNPADYSLRDGTALWQLARDSLDQVARHFHPHKQQPLLELTVPHTLLIIERASRELREEIVHTLPFSHRLTLGNLLRARKFQQTAARYHKAYRLGRALISPASAVYKEFSRAVSGHIMDYGSERLQRWLLQEYVRKVGFYAIELYSGNLLLSGALTSSPEEPLRVLVLGPARSGKSSLIQAVSGGTAEPSPAESTTYLNAQRLYAEEWGTWVLWDTPAWSQFPRSPAKEAVRHADIIIWVSHAADRNNEEEVEQLTRIRRWLEKRAGQPEPPLLVAITHSEQIQAHSLQTRIAEQLRLPPAHVLTLSLKDPLAPAIREQLHNAFGTHHPQAVRSQYWRLLRRQRRTENRELAGRQLRNGASRAWHAARGLFKRGKHSDPP